MKGSTSHILSFLIKATLLLWAGTGLIAGNLSAQQSPAFLSYPHSHIDWYTIESERFLIHFQEGNDRPARIISRISEEIWDEVTTLYDYEPDIQISLILIDREDYSNGAAYFFDNKIEIWLPSLDTPFRGTTDWLRNVITHEFVHIVQIQASLSGSRKRPVTYLQWLSYEDVRRPDVLYGYPSGIISYPFTIVSVPAWFAEGTAQFMRKDLHYDYWDSHRDMLLRTRILDGKELGLVEMGHFSSKTSMERELAYNMGFSFTEYLSNRFGEQSIADITNGLKRTNDIRTAMRRVTGIAGEEIYNNWIDSLRTHYQNAMADLREHPSETVEPMGFINFNPVFTPDGKIAYVSNKPFDFTRTALFVVDPENGEQSERLGVGDISLVSEYGFRHSCGMHSAPVISRIGNGFAFSPDGSKILYNRIRQNRFGETYNDFYLYDRENEDTEKLTFDARISQPAWHPEENKVAALQLKDGTQNLVIFDLETKEITQITSMMHGEQLFNPIWAENGNAIIAAKNNPTGRRIVRISLEPGAEITDILTSPDVDFRDPFISNDGNYLYFSADFGGKFDLFRKSFDSGDIQRLTDVRGGAFMPNVSENGDVLYAEFTSDGYKIKKARVEDMLSVFGDDDRELRPAFRPDLTRNPLNTFDDSDIDPFSEEIYSIADTSAYSFSLATRGQSDFRQFYSYNDTFLSFSFYPVIRFDNYSQEFGRNSSLVKAGNFGDLGRNILRDTKVGFYMSSREVRERFSIFGGMLIGLASLEAETINDFFRPARLVDLDRDLFLIAEYTGLPFIDRHWSPTIEVALYNLRRNVKSGLEIEEFRCTACLPDTTAIDIAYDVWQAEINLYSKINQFSLVQLGYHYTPYRVSTKTFFSQEFNQFVPGSTSRYFIGSTITAAYILDAYLPSRHGDIAPIGFRGHVRYNYQPGRLLDNYEIRDGNLIPVYNNFKNHSVELDARLGFMALGFRNFQIRSRFFSYFSSPDEYFFLDYIGGFDGMRSYPFFALGGNTTAFGQLSYFMPVWTGINRQSGQFTLDKIFARFFVEAGNGWGGPLGIDKTIKSGIGAELRVSLNSYYLFPTRLFLSGAYGFNSFDLRIPEGFVSAAGRDRVSFGREVIVNFGILFDFEF